MQSIVRYMRDFNAYIMSLITFIIIIAFNVSNKTKRRNRRTDVGRFLFWNLCETCKKLTKAEQRTQPKLKCFCTYIFRLLFLVNLNHWLWSTVRHKKYTNLHLKSSSHSFRLCAFLRFDPAQSHITIPLLSHIPGNRMKLSHTKRGWYAVSCMRACVSVCAFECSLSLGLNLYNYL